MQGHRDARIVLPESPSSGPPCPSRRKGASDLHVRPRRHRKGNPGTPSAVAWQRNYTSGRGVAFCDKVLLACRRASLRLRWRSSCRLAMFAPGRSIDGGKRPLTRAFVAGARACCMLAAGHSLPHAVLARCAAGVQQGMVPAEEGDASAMRSREVFHQQMA